MFDLPSTTSAHTEIFSKSGEVDLDLLLSMFDARSEELLGADLNLGGFGRHLELFCRDGRNEMRSELAMRKCGCDCLLTSSICFGHRDGYIPEESCVREPCGSRMA